MKTPSTMQANMFHAGSTCPFCQENIDDGQIIVRCEACGSIHHESCWTHADGCSSYHCSKSMKSETDLPELTITAGDLKDVYIPPFPPKRSPEEAARAFLPQKPKRLSKLAVAGIAVSSLAAVGIYGVIAADTSYVIFGICVSVVSMLIAVSAIVAVNSSKQVYGFMPAGISVMISAGLTLLFFAYLHKATSNSMESMKVNLQLSERMPTEEELNRMAPSKAMAMRANVVVKRSANALAGTVIGSGVVIKLVDHNAYILTNKHVIGEKEKPQIDIIFYNAECSEATVEWRAPDGIDLAIIRCQALSLSSNNIVIYEGLLGQGEHAFAVGNPMNLYWSYTEGVISGIREKMFGLHKVYIYQTQTPINQGNSGGGLYTQEGELVGINTWTQDKSVAEGLSFSISTKSLLGLLDDGQKKHFLAIPENDEQVQVEEEPVK
ncbi:MAG: trypsin-like peptidase domain-containing protein [Planctomycetes bacterium]|nr:trypsin-like peptidase domain-containing protein [Planctomycetota bacterium]